MSRWHPALGTPDPEAAWFTPEQLAAHRRAEHRDRAISRRDRFEQAIAELANPTPEAIAAAWDEAEEPDQ